MKSRTPLHGILGSIDALRMELENLMVSLFAHHCNANWCRLELRRTPPKCLSGLRLCMGVQSHWVKYWVCEWRWLTREVLTATTDNMILLSKLDSTVSIGSTPSTKEDFPLRPFLREIYHLAVAYPKAPGVIFRYFIDEKVPQICVTDRIGLRQVCTYTLGAVVTVVDLDQPSYKRPEVYLRRQRSAPRLPSSYTTIYIVFWAIWYSMSILLSFSFLL